MPRYRHPPLTIDALQQEGPPVRLRDLCRLTGRSRASLIAEIDRGTLPAFRYLSRPGSPWYVERAIAADWWTRVTERSTRHTL